MLRQSIISAHEYDEHQECESSSRTSESVGHPIYRVSLYTNPHNSLDLTSRKQMNEEKIIVQLLSLNDYEWISWVLNRMTIDLIKIDSFLFRFPTSTSININRMVFSKSSRTGRIVSIPSINEQFLDKREIVQTSFREEFRNLLFVCIRLSMVTCVCLFFTWKFETSILNLCVSVCVCVVYSFSYL